MKIKIQYKGKTLTLAYISLTKNSIVCWGMPQYLNERLTQIKAENLDFHVTYPKDGNVHYSYK